MGLCFWEQLRSSVNSTEIFRGRRSSDGAQLPSSQMAELWLGYFLAGAGGAASLLFCSISGWVLVYNYGNIKEKWMPLIVRAVRSGQFNTLQTG